MYSIWLLGFLKQNIDGKIWFGHSIPTESFRSHIKRMGITEILRRIWLFSANKIKSSESVSKQPTQLIVAVEIKMWTKITKYGM